MIKENILLKCFIAIVAAVLLFGIDSYAQTPDSLKVTTGLDTLKTNLADTLAVAQDSLAAGADSLAAKKDSVEVKVLSQKEIRKLQRDTIRMRRDSAIKNTPRILLTYVFTDTIKNQRMFLWNADTYFNKPVNIDPDTTYNDWFVETPDRKNDVGANYLGVAGSAMVYNNWFKRPELEVFPFFEPYLPYSYTTETLPFYNTKTPYTELAY